MNFFRLGVVNWRIVTITLVAFALSLFFVFREAPFRRYAPRRLYHPSQRLIRSQRYATCIGNGSHFESNRRFTSRLGTALLLASCPLAMAVVGHKPREEGRQAKADRERKRRKLWDETNREVDEIVAQYHARFPRSMAKSIGAIYARYSTRHQDSIADQVRKILEEAIRLEVYVPREHVFFDLAVRGFKKHRPALDGVQAILKAKQADTLLLFATNRLFRKVYRTLEFVDRVHKGWGIRCVFVKSGIDTNDANRWEMTLHTLSLIDQFVVTVYVENIRASHEGLLEKRFVFGTLSFGYRGEPVKGLTTKRGRPTCRIVIDDQTSKIVKQVFSWFVDDGVSINENIRRLNDDTSIPLPPRSRNGMWTRTAVLQLLKNTRYRGLWRYGVTEAVYVPDGDYVRQNTRAEPLKEVTLDELRIVDDETWFAAQKRLAKEGFRNRGRRPADGDRRSRPRLLNGLFYCPEHDHILYVGGPNGCSMHCRRCQELTSKKRPLYTLLNRKLALKLTCDKLAELVRADEKLVQDVIAACQVEAEMAKQPDPDRLQQLRSQEQQLQRSIEFSQRNPGETEEDQTATAKIIRQFRNERNEVLREMASLEQARKRRPAIPTTDEIRCMLQELDGILTAAADGEMEDNAAIAREVIDMLTGGRINLVQNGERAGQNRGWLQGWFNVDLVSVLAAKVTGVRPSESRPGLEVVIDYQAELLVNEQEEEAMRLYEDGKLGKEIAVELSVSRSHVCTLLDRAFDKRGLKRPDGRRRRAGLENKQVKTPLYKRIAVEAVRLAEEGWSDLAIGRHFKTSDATVSKAIAFGYTARGLPVPTAADRRRMKLQRAKLLYEDGALIKDIAPVVGYSPRGLILALREFYAELGETMPDGRSRRGNAKSGQRASGHAARNRHDDDQQ